MKNLFLTLSGALLLAAHPLHAQTTTFNYTGGFQNYTSPGTGWYFLDASGAQGGYDSHTNHVGGKGARMQGYVQLNAGDVLRIAVGGMGLKGGNDGNNVSGGGGGGGSSIIKVNGSTYVPLLMAGGGGGGAARYDGSPGLTTLDGGFDNGGTNGTGGRVDGTAYYGGAGGAGYAGNGGSHYTADNSSLLSKGGVAYSSGANPNVGGSSSANGGRGGWGGGGQGGPAKSAFANNHDGGGGGGGGYSGGGGAPDEGGGGGGGGSFVATDLNTAPWLWVEGDRSGDGIVTVERLVFQEVDPVNQTFGSYGSNFRTFTVPATGYYLITALGGAGGWANGGRGGLGAQMQSYFLLRAGQVLQIAAGLKGQDARKLSSPGKAWDGFWTGAGGGGSSSVVLKKGDALTLLLMAGGGGGASVYSAGGAAGIDSQGLNGLGAAHAGNGGNNGEGGWSDLDLGSSGGGWLGDGQLGGQAYLNGNQGAQETGLPGESGPAGGWGGGGGGALPNKFTSETSGYQFYADGPGGGGGGYSGGGHGGYKALNDYLPEGGGGGGSWNAAQLLGDDRSGVNAGAGYVTISGPNVVKDVINATAPPYTWPVNGVAYQNAGRYYHADPSQAVLHVLDLSFSGVAGCVTYDFVGDNVVSCGGFTWPPTGRTFTENATDAFRLGCTYYTLELIVAPPTTALAVPTSDSGSLLTASSPPDYSTGDFVACRNSTQTFSMSAVPYATFYHWSLPPGASGFSTSNSIVVSFNNRFNGGPICVTPANDCGAGDSVCHNIAAATRPPGGRLIVNTPLAPYVSGFYSVAPIAGATDYTWSVSKDQATIVSGQGTPSIQLEARPGFTRANLTVVASNCRGAGSRVTVPLMQPPARPRQP